MNNSVIGTAIKQTNWALVSSVMAATVTAITFFASIKSDIRDLSTQLLADHTQTLATNEKVDKLFDMVFAANVKKP